MTITVARNTRLYLDGRIVGVVKDIEITFGGETKPTWRRSWRRYVPRRAWPLVNLLLLLRWRPGYCERCGMWAWTYRQPVNRSTYVARLCRECGVDEEAECQAAWAEYYSGLL